MNTSELQKLLKDRKHTTVLEICDKTLAQTQKLDVNEKKQALHFKGMAHYFLNQLGQSIECFKAVLEIDPKYTDSAITLSIIYNDIGKYDDAKKVYDVANQSLTLKKHGLDSSLDRKFALKHIEIADLYFKYHRYEEAIDDYTKAIRLDPDELEHRIKLAKVYSKKGYTTRALQELKQISSENPEYLPAKIQLGLMYFSLGNVIDAQLEWDKVVKLDPKNDEVHTYMTMARQATETSL